MACVIIKIIKMQVTLPRLQKFGTAGIFLVEVTSPTFATRSILGIKEMLAHPPIA